MRFDQNRVSKSPADQTDDCAVERANPGPGAPSRPGNVLSRSPSEANTHPSLGSGLGRDHRGRNNRRVDTPDARGRRASRHQGLDDRGRATVGRRGRGACDGGHGVFRDHLTAAQEPVKGRGRSGAGDGGEESQDGENDGGEGAHL